jgi:GNAT superfamily N-acetyltransferase
MRLDIDLGENRVVARRPADCSPDQIRAFVRIVASGGEVKEKDIANGAERAEYLLWIAGHSNALAAVAALKRPFDSYRRRISRKTGVDLRADDFAYEFGYACTVQEHRRRGHGRRLLARALDLASRDGVYATVRADNSPMRSLLEVSGFGKAGEEYRSQGRDARLVLYTRPGIVAAVAKSEAML